MTCGGCGCFCHACDGCIVVPGNGDRQTAPLLDHQYGGRTTETSAPGRAAEKIVLMVMISFSRLAIRGIWIFLMTYLFDSVKRYAVNYTGGDTWFATFAMIVVVVPVVELILINIQAADVLYTLLGTIPKNNGS